jgi:hypothetical protein
LISSVSIGALYQETGVVFGLARFVRVARGRRVAPIRRETSLSARWFRELSQTTNLGEKFQNRGIVRRERRTHMRTNARTINTLASAAVADRSNFEAIRQPCSVNTSGRRSDLLVRCNVPAICGYIPLHASGDSLNAKPQEF